MEGYSYTPSYPDSSHSSPRSRDIDYENSLSSWDDSSSSPGEDLDALISVTNDEDLENLMQEYERIYKLSSKPARFRLFLFGVGPNCQPPSSFGSDDSIATKSEKERFVEALNSVEPPPQAVLDPPAGNNMDFLFGLEKGGIAIDPPPPPPVVAGSRLKVFPPVQEQGGGYPIQNQIQDLQRLSIEEQNQAMYRKKIENDVVESGGFTVHGAGGYYFPNIQDNVAQLKVPATVSMQTGAGYWTENHVPGGFPRTEPPYMIQTRQGAYDHHPQMMRPVTGPPTNQGYYTLQNLPPGQSYSNQQIPLNLSPISTTVTPIVVAPPPPQPQPQIQPPLKATPYSEGYAGAIRPPGSGGYTQVACDNNGIGKQVYYAAHGGGVVAAPPPAQQQQQAAIQQYHQAIGASGVSGGEVKALNQKAVTNFVGKVTHGSV